jgi:hypothetical protein
MTYMTTYEFDRALALAMVKVDKVLPLEEKLWDELRPFPSYRSRDRPEKVPGGQQLKVGRVILFAVIRDEFVNRRVSGYTDRPKKVHCKFHVNWLRSAGV